jgi:hypothetical protein
MEECLVNLQSAGLVETIIVSAFGVLIVVFSLIKKSLPSFVGEIFKSALKIFGKK